MHLRILNWTQPKKLEDFRLMNNSLASKLYEMNDKLSNYNELVKKVKSSSDDSSKPASISTTEAASSSSYEKRMLGHFAREFQQLSSEFKNSSAKIETLESILHKMESFSPDTKDEIRIMELEIQVLENLNSQLRSKLMISNAEILQLTEAANLLRREKENAECESLSTKMELRKLQEANSSVGSSPSTMFLCMKEMKQAFMESEKVLEAKNEEIARNHALIKHFENYCNKVNKYLEDKSSAAVRAEREQWELEKSEMLSEKKELQKTVVTLEDKLITSETKSAQLKNLLQYYTGQIENLHKSWIRNLSGSGTAEFEKLLRDEDQDSPPISPDAGSGDATKNNLQI